MPAFDWPANKCVSARLERRRLCRWPQRDRRIPLGGRAIRATAGACGRPCATTSHNDRCVRWRPRRACRESGNHNDPDRVCDWQRSGQVRPSREPQSAQWQRHGYQLLHRRTRSETIGFAPSTTAVTGQCRGGSLDLTDNNRPRPGPPCPGRRTA